MNIKTISREVKKEYMDLQHNQLPRLYLKQ
jgi:hypothetical protein